MIPLALSWLSTPIGRAAGIVLVVVALVGGWFSWLHVHDAVVRSADAAAVQTETVRQQARDAVDGTRAVEGAATEDSVRASALTRGLLEVGDGTSLGDPALRRALERMQSGAGAGGSGNSSP